MHWIEGVILLGLVPVFGFIWLTALYYVSHDYPLWNLLKKIIRNEV